ncbi:MAG: hypothetical protein WAT79_08915 [Saprospiraceae bacterium]
MSSPNPSHITYSSEKVVWTIVAKNNGSTPYNSDVKVALSWNHPVNYLRVSSDTDGMQGVQFGDGSAVGTVFNRTTSVWNVGPLSVGQEKKLYVETSFDELQNLDNLLPLILTKTLTLDSGIIPNNVHVVSSDVLRKGVVPLPNEVDCSKVRYGPPGPPGPSGLDNYTLAVQNGFVGDIDAWILSLQGATGPVGPAGQGLAAGGTMGQVLYKTNGTDYMTHWGNPLYDYYLASIGTFDPLNPLVGWTQPSLVDASNAVVQFTDGTIAYYSCNGVVWSLSFKDDVIKRVANYTALRALDNYFHNTVVVDDFSYTGPDGNPYTTLGGIFIKVTAGTENGGTIIVSTNGDIWERVWNKIEVQPEWWECGGFNYLGKNYIDRFTGTVSGAVNGVIEMDGVYNDCDRVRNASIVGGENAIIKLGALVKEYDIDINIPIFKHQIFDMNGVVFKRSNTETPDILSSSGLTPSGINIIVSSTGGYRLGQSTIMLNTTATYDGQGYNENYNQNPGGTGIIYAIVGTTISLSQLGASTPVNAILCLEVTMLGKQIGDFGNIVIQNGNFDGNNTNGSNPLYGNGMSFSADWRFNYTIELGNQTNNALISNCTFKNTPAENITFAAGTIEKCTYNDLGGSFVHISSGDTTTTGISIVNCKGVGSNLIGNQIMYHSEAVITYSANPQNCKIINCKFEDGYENIFGPVTEYCNVNITSSTFINFNHIVVVSVGGFPNQSQEFKITNSTFLNCKDLLITSSVTHPFKNILISNNYFENTRFYFVWVDGALISNNIIKNTTSLIPNTFSSGIAASKSQITLWECSNVSIQENKLIAKRSLDVECIGGISFFTNFPEQSTIDSDYFLSSNIVIKNNNVENYKRGIGYWSDVWFVREKEWIGWIISDNIIKMCQDYNGITEQWSFGIYSEPGYIVSNNIIYEGYLHPSNRNYLSYPIVANGIDDQLDGANEKSKLRGSVIYGNKIISNSIANYSIALGTYAYGIYNFYNVSLINNIISKPHYHSSATPIASAYISNINPILPDLTTPENIIW